MNKDHEVFLKKNKFIPKDIQKLLELAKNISVSLKMTNNAEMKYSIWEKEKGKLEHFFSTPQINNS